VREFREAAHCAASGDLVNGMDKLRYAKEIKEELTVDNMAAGTLKITPITWLRLRSIKTVATRLAINLFR